MKSIQTYFYSVFTLFKGSAFAHLITLITLPILTRLYSKEQFGYLAIVVSVAAILSILFSFRLDLAVFNSKSDEDEAHILTTTVVISFCALILSLLFLVGASEFLIDTTPIPNCILFFMPFAAFLLVIFNLLTNLAIIKERYNLVKNVKVFRAVCLSFFQISLSFFGKGLLFAELLGRASGFYQLLKIQWKKIKKYHPTWSTKKTLVRHQNFIKFSIFAGVFNTASVQFSTIFIGFYFGPSLAGIYLLTNRLAALPIALLGQSMSQVFSSKFKALVKTEDKISLIKGVVTKSLIISSLFFSLAVLLVPFVIPLIFGEEWTQSADYFIYLTPMLIAQLSIFPISNTLNMLNHQKYQMVWDVSRGGGLALLAYLTINLRLSIEHFLILYSSIMTTFYIVLYSLVYKFAKNA